MATHDYVIDNQSAPAFRSDLNNALLAIVSQNSASTAPTTTYADMFWYDTATNILKKRNEANSAWITLGTIDEGTGTFTPSGQPATQAQADWNTGTATIESTITPAKLDDKIENKLNVSGTAPMYACRAWVNFNGTGTVAIRASGNVSSITDNGTGLYTINFTTALPDANYCPVVSCASNSIGTGVQVHSATQFGGAAVKTTTALQVSGRADSGTAFDVTEVYVSVFR
jgi:hypothetical protein